MLVHYLTSFSRKLYLATGKNLVKSYGKFQVKIGEPNLLLQYSEDTAAPCRPINPDYLNWYLQTFKHLIPPNLGGTADGRICAVKHNGIVSGKIVHKPGCHNTLWNRNAYRWFHKVAAIKTWLDSDPQCDYMVWLDCDCYFKQHLPNSVIAKLASDKDICYLKGTKREAIESGILIFNMQEAGKIVIKTWFERYKHQLFMVDNRWDDGYQLTVALKTGLMRVKQFIQNFDRQEFPEKPFSFRIKVPLYFKTNDLVAGKAIGRPADDCPLTPYIGHNKGTHVRDHQLF